MEYVVIAFMIIGYIAGLSIGVYGWRENRKCHTNGRFFGDFIWCLVEIPLICMFVGFIISLAVLFIVVTHLIIPLIIVIIVTGVALLIVWWDKVKAFITKDKKEGD